MTRTPVADDGTPRRRKLEAALGIPFFPDNRVTVLRNGDEIFPAMLEAIDAAAHSIKFLTFVYWTGEIADRVADALSRKATAGVDVKVLLDSFGAKAMRQDLIDRMTGAGVDIAWFRPLASWRLWAADNRTHRKILVVDDRIGFTGGVGIAKEWEGDARDPSEWRDTHFRITGPAVRGLIAGFVGNWSETGRRIDGEISDGPHGDPAAREDDGVDSGGDDGGDYGAEDASVGGVAVQVVRSTATIGWSDVATLLQALLELASDSIRITTPYFMPDERTVSQLVEAVERGIEVDILIPGEHVDKRVSELAAAEDFEALLSAGIRIWRYQRTMLHAKIITVDGAVACVGSPNFNRRSMRKDDEIALVFDNAEIAGILDAQFDDDCRLAKRWTNGEWRRRGIARRVLETGARVLRPHV